MNDISQLPYSQSCENNKNAILSILNVCFANTQNVLEIGSGTGQHAVHFAQHLPHLTWYPSDQSHYIEHLALRLALEGSANIAQPIPLDVLHTWPCDQLIIDGIFTANTMHIMSESMVKAFFKGVGKHLSPGGICCIYGPFNYDNRYTSESNRQFDIWLKHRNPHSGIRDQHKIVELAAQAQMSLTTDHEMPANNRLLQFFKNE
ncbi:DUF938 domain-containing protein [Shewanella psychrotolerans]|uniref:DUF938 domain-containing protein n=1 Tax=Shewanella psychrotolerans TaxID=2864206 RepID=UPI001C65BE5E|nr:DUF938 domain-containing protein [Shewanella psychrotolerans]QYK00023.1 DUF938 domain-containing protein [Shewanella psychrotolerans]